MGGGTLFDYLAAARQEVHERRLSVVPSPEDDAEATDDVEDAPQAALAVEQAPIIETGTAEDATENEPAGAQPAEEPLAPVITAASGLTTHSASKLTAANTNP